MYYGMKGIKVQVCKYEGLNQVIYRPPAHYFVLKIDLYSPAKIPDPLMFFEPNTIVGAALVTRQLFRVQVLGKGRSSEGFRYITLI